MQIAKCKLTIAERRSPICNLQFLLCLLLALGWFLVGGVHSAAGDVLVLANRTPSAITVQVGPQLGGGQRLTLPAGDSVPVLVEGRANVAFTSQGQPKQYLVDPNCAYFFGRAANGRIDLQKIGLGEDASTAEGRRLPGSTRRVPVATIPVKILVDEEEPARRPVWERRLRRRVEAASTIVEKHSGVRLQVVATDTWITDNSITDFHKSLAEFEQKVDPAPARLAIGFTSQFQVLRGRVHMAGTRGPLHSHILLREFSPQLGEAERLEFLVHELGHFLGASHSPERSSVMRPVLGDKQAGRSDFQIRFDPVNTLAMSIVGEEMRRRNVRKFADLTDPSRRRLGQIYGQLARALPNDASSRHFVALANAAGRRRTANTTPQVARKPQGNPPSLADGTKRVLARLRQAAEANHALAPADANSGVNGNEAGTQPSSRREGDALLEYYVREAAEAASKLHRDVAPAALLVALGIAIDDTGTLEVLPQVRAIAQQAETPDERGVRRATFGRPTMLGRSDLAKHFAVSACLTAKVGVQAAHSAGVAKEMLDAQGGSGFSFADMAANQAGITFADSLLKQRLSVEAVRRSFSVPLVMPSIEGLPEGLTAQQLATEYGNPKDDRFRRQLREIERRVQALPPYRTVGVLPSP